MTTPAAQSLLTTVWPPRRCRGALLALVATAGPTGCASTPEGEATVAAKAPAATHIDVPPPPDVEPVPASRHEYYRRAFPSATRFEARAIPKEMIPTSDAGNDRYVVAYDGSGRLLGYLRNFTGPVSTAEDCPCSPLTLTLALRPDYSLETLLSPAPLEKRDKQQMTPADLERLIALAKDPPKELLELRRAEAVVDATTGATKSALKPHVVDAAGYSTWRVVHLVRATQNILKGAPLAWDSRRLRVILDTPATPMARARALAEFLPTAESDETRRGAYRTMARAYIEALVAGSETDTPVEKRLIAPPLAASVRAEEMVHACYELAQSGQRLALASQCARLAKGNTRHPPDPAALARLTGTITFEKGDRAAAAAALQRGASDVPVRHDPALHLRLTQALTAAGKKRKACASARAVYREHPLLDGAKAALKACGDPAQVAAAVRAEQKKALLARRLDGTTPAPDLSLETPDYRPMEVTMAAEGQATVLIFFATWCPHCLNELPQINAFVEAVEEDAALRGEVRVVAVRTAVERETIPYSTFLSRIEPEFPIAVDATMSLAFGKFARAHGIRTSLPTVAVLDPQGVVRYFLESGPYRDVQRELTWAVEDVLNR